MSRFVGGHIGLVFLDAKICGFDFGWHIYADVDSIRPSISYVSLFAF